MWKNGERDSQLTIFDTLMIPFLLMIQNDNIQDRQRITDRVFNVGEKFGLKMNVTKTKLMVISSGGSALMGGHQYWEYINANVVELVFSFRYHRANLNGKWNSKNKIYSRIKKVEKYLLLWIYFVILNCSFHWESEWFDDMCSRLLVPYDGFVFPGLWEYQIQKCSDVWINRWN